MTRCGYCGRPREVGDVCCVEQARNQGRLHATCNHPAPPMPAEWRREYDRVEDHRGRPVERTDC